MRGACPLLKGPLKRRGVEAPPFRPYIGVNDRATDGEGAMYNFMLGAMHADDTEKVYDSGN